MRRCGLLCLQLLLLEGKMSEIKLVWHFSHLTTHTIRGSFPDSDSSGPFLHATTGSGGGGRCRQERHHNHIRFQHMGAWVWPYNRGLPQVPLTLYTRTNGPIHSFLSLSLSLPYTFRKECFGLFPSFDRFIMRTPPFSALHSIDHTHTHTESRSPLMMMYLCLIYLTQQGKKNTARK